MHKILIIEDEVILRDAYTILLESQDGFELSVAADGAEALELCRKNTFDLILLDLMMPVLDGVGFLKKADPVHTMPNTRIIVMSNLSSGEILAKALQSGAHHSIVKSSLGPKEVLDTIKSQLPQA